MLAIKYNKKQFCQSTILFELANPSDGCIFDTKMKKVELDESSTFIHFVYFVCFVCFVYL